MKGRVVSNQIETQIKKYLSAKTKRVEFLNTGCTLLNLAASQRGRNGGIPRGRIINFVGDGSSGKTLLALEICAYVFYNIKNTQSEIYPKIKKIEIVYNNVEGVMDLPIEQMYGEKFVKGIKWIQIGICEDFGRDYMKRLQNLKPGAFLLYVCDSLDATVPRAVMNKTIKSIKSDTEEGETFGAEKAKYFSNKFFDRLCGMMSGKDATLICISQVREKIGVMFGEMYKRTGGKALDFYTHLVLWLSEIKKLTKTYKGHTRVYGVKLRGKFKRSKVAKPFREADFTVLFDYGIDNIGTTIDYIYGQNTNKLIKWNNGKENIKMSRSEFIEYLERKPKALDRLLQKMESLWNKIEDKTSVKRKARFEK